jgi:hypothetical protein
MLYNPNAMKKNIIFLSFFTLFFICGIFYPIVNLLSKDKTKDLQNLVLEKIRAVLKQTIPHLNKAIQDSDDISLLSNIESMASALNVTSCFILDENSKVLIHNNTTEWNTEKDAEIYKKAIAQKEKLVQKMPDDNLFLISEPMLNNYTLMCLVSVQESKEYAKYWQIKYYSIATAVTILIIIIIYFLSKLLILSPFNRIKRSLQNNQENEKDIKYNEITNIFTAERNKISKKIKTLEENNKSFTKIIEHLCEPSIKDSLAFILLNSSNEIIYSYDSTRKILKEDNIPKNNSHIIETVKDPNIANIVIKANEESNKEILKSLENYKISVTSLSKNNEIAGTIIKITR